MIKKININLNPNKQNGIEEGFAKVLSYTPLLILLLLFFLLVTGVIEVVSQAKMSQKKRLSGVWQEWEPRHRDLMSLRRDTSALKRQKKEIKGVVSSEDTGIIFLEKVGSYLPENIWLDNLRFTEGLAQINGYIVRWEEDTLASLEKFINTLQEDESFQERFRQTNIRDTKRIMFRGKEVTQFFLECRK